MGLLLLSLVRDHVELSSEQPLRRPSDFASLERRIDGRVRAVKGRDERAHTFVQDARGGEWTPLTPDAWPLPAVARLRVQLVPRFRAASF